MLLLAFDTSTSAVTVALADGDDVVARADAVGHNQQGESLAPAIQRVLADAGVRPASLDAIGVGVGPGPFTGLRVGIATARAMSHALGIPAYGACSLDAVGAGPRVVLTDARRREVYWATYDETGARVEGPAVGKPADVAPLLPAGLPAVGQGVELYAEAFAAWPRGEARWPDAAAIARLAAATRATDLRPLYLRRPDAALPGARKPVLR